eukprot:474048_1
MHAILNESCTLLRLAIIVSFSVKCTGFLSVGDWNLETPLLPDVACMMAVGYWDNSIFILGGSSPHQYNFVEYDISKDTMSRRSSLSLSVHGYGQFYTQIHNELFMIHKDGDSLLVMDLSSSQKTLQTNWNSVVILTTVSNYGCLASTDEHLFVAAGWDNPNYLNELQILTIATLSWQSNVPPMDIPRRGCACTVHETSAFLFVIGGYNGASKELKSIEKISINNIANIHNEEWKSVKNLTYGVDMPRSIAYSEYVLVVGGRRANNVFAAELHIIDTTTDSVSVSDSTMHYGASNFGVILVDNVIYKFGGINTLTPSPITDGWLNQWETCQLTSSIPSNDPSIAPSNNPTDDPTDDPTNAPTVNPTDDPSIAPSNNPTNDPTNNPTNTPT